MRISEQPRNTFTSKPGTASLQNLNRDFFSIRNPQSTFRIQLGLSKPNSREGPINHLTDDQDLSLRSNLS